MSHITPVLAPLMALLRSRKVMVALAFLGATLLTAAVPDLAPHRESIQVALLVFGSALIAGIAWEDGQEKRALGIEEALAAVREGPDSPREAGKHILFEAADTLLGEEDE
ncbi:MAG: hypothetical protein IT323_10325 [Anaerolineae bacterium]|nr:hypothetical protein [Anaerolineae bacterium]